MDDTPGVATVDRQFGSWIAAIDASGLDCRDSSGENHPDTSMETISTSSPTGPNNGKW